MTKPKRPPSDLQMEFGFGVPERVSTDGSLADLGAMTARAVGEVLKGDPRSRFDVAADVSRLSDADVSKWMLDAYASPARDGHTVSFERMLVLIAATGRYDLLRPMLRRIGCDLVVGEDVYLTEIGHLEAEKRLIEARLRQVKSVAAPMQSGRRAP